MKGTPFPDKALLEMRNDFLYFCYMESIIIDINNKKEAKFFAELVKKLGFTSRVLTAEEKEDIALVKAIDEGKKGKYVSRESVMKALRK